MTWQNEMTPILRFLINDLDPTSYTYTDERLQNCILISSQLIQKEIDFEKTYDIDIANSGLMPDPSASPEDNVFINLVCLKAATIIFGGELKLASKSSLKVVDGPSQIDTTSRFFNMSQLYKTSIDNYNRAKVDYFAGNSIAGRSILTPYTTPNGITTNEGYVYRW